MGEYSLMKRHSHNFTDTIVAISTPVGHSGIGVIRLSGPEAVPLVASVFRPYSGRADFPDRVAIYGAVVDPDNGRTLDDCVVVVMRGPRSYTGEDVVEISLHGSPILLDMVTRLLIKQGARPAGKGEFTRRAFLAGKLDLIQAEAVIDLIKSSSESAAQEARARLDRSLTNEILGLSNSLKDLLAEIEAHIDFDEEDEEPSPDVKGQLRTILERIESLKKSARAGKARREGIKTVIAGKPNVGKSTLFNALIRSDRMIVTPHPGTTRDPVDERMVMDGIGFVISDTAGIRDKAEPVEKEGIRRTLARMEDAAIIIAVIDASAGLDREDLAVLAECSGKTTICALNKIDLELVVDPTDESLRQVDGRVVPISARTGAGVDALEQALIELGRDLTAVASEGGLNERCLLLVEAVEETISRVLGSVERGESVGPEVVSLEVREALSRLEELTGERVDEGVLDRIFERFCVGK
jgi:tRNA modification GTPase